MHRKRHSIALSALGVYFVALLSFQSRLTWEDFNRQLHITEIARPPFTLGPSRATLNALQPEAIEAGLNRADRLIALDGAVARGERSPQAAVHGRKAGETMPVIVERNGIPITAAVRLQAASSKPLSLQQWLVFAFLDVLTPWLCLVVAFGVAFQRPRDPLAWLLLMLLASFGGVAQAGRVLVIVAGWELPTRPLATLYYLTITNSWGFWMVLFGQYFPDRSVGTSWDRMIRWVLGGSLAAYAILWGLSNSLATEDVRAMPFEALVQRWSTYDVVAGMAGIGVFFAYIFLKMWRATLPDARRRLRLLVSGAAVSLTPVVLLALSSLLMGRPFLAFLGFSPWLWIPSLLLLFLFPVTLAYVIVVAHAMEVSVVIRQGLQYALARGGARLLVGAVVVALAIYSARVVYEPGIARPQLLLVLVFLAGAFVALRLVSGRLYGWIDRHFFREAVNTERVLAELSEKVRSIVEAEPLLKTVTETISSVLHVTRVSALIRRNGDFVPAYAVGFGGPAPGISFAAQLADRVQGQPLRAAPSTLRSVEQSEDNSLLKTLGAELLLPLVANNRLLGFLSLGPKRSEAPYSPSDVRLLESVALQTGLALENSRLTEEMAHEIAHRERMARELEIARDVQQRLFPQESPAIGGLDYEGTCRPAATIGGDYYDFLPLPAGRIGFAIGDVSGKGIPAALLMASLRASLRGLAITGSGEIPELMANLNRLIYEASPSDRFATLFYGVFDPAARTFRFVNAGHNPPILFRAATGEVVRLKDGGLMIGGFRSARYQQGCVHLSAGDTMVMFTDGISEAVNSEGEEFGEERVIDTVRTNSGLPAAHLSDRILGALDSFSTGAPQQDDVTLVVVRAVG